MDPDTRVCCSVSTRLPRSRGDGPTNPVPQAGYMPAAPLTRGWTPASASAAGSAGGCPAHAGMDPPERIATRCVYGLPRSRGDGPASHGVRRTSAEAAPLTRGWTRVDRGSWRALRGCPAHAGMDPCPRTSPWPNSRLPRSRGDGPGVFTGYSSGREAAPLTRGWTHYGRGEQWLAWGCPAHAGMDPPRLWRCRCR